MESDTSWDHLSQHTPSTQVGFWQIDNQPRSTLDRLISQAQDSPQTRKQTRKHPKPSMTYNDVYSDSDDTLSDHQPKRKNNQISQSQPTL